MAYGYQYIPSEPRRDGREACGPGNGTKAEPGVDARVFRVGPAASAIAEAIAALYRDVDHLRVSAAELESDENRVPMQEAVA